MFQLENRSEKSVKQVAIFLLSVLLLACLSLIPSLLKVKTTYDIEQFLPKGDATFETAKKVRHRFKLSDSPGLAILIENKNGWLHPHQTEKVASLTQRLADIKYVENALSFATRPGAQLTHRQVQVGRLSEIVPPDQWSNRFSEDPLMTPLLLSEDQKTALIYLELGTSDIKRMKTVFARAEKLTHETFPKAAIHLGGIPALQAGFQSLLESEVARFVALSFLTTFALIFALFRGFVPVAISFVTVLLSNLAVLGVMGLFGYDLTVLSVTVPVLVTVTVVAQVVHTFFRLYEHRQSASWFKHVQVQKDLFMPNFLANLTTAVGFLTLVPSEIPMIKEYGGVVAAAVMVSWLMASLLLPLLTVLSPAPHPRQWALMKARWGLWVLRHKKEWSLGILAVSVVASLGGFFLNWGTRVFDDLPENHPSRVTTEQLDAEFGGAIPLNVQITAKKASYWKDPKNIERLDRAISELRQEAGIGQALSYVDFLKAFDAKSKFPKTSQGVSELMFLYSMSGKNPIQQFLTVDGKNIRVQIKLHDIPGDKMAALVSKIEKNLSKSLPGTRVLPTGMANHLHPTNNRVSAELIFGFWQAMFAIFLILIPVFRSVRWALVACLPNLVPPALLLGVMAILQTPIKPPLALIFSISLGLAFNNTVYVFDRLQALIKKGRTSRLIAHVFLHEGMNCLHSTFVVLAGFAVFLFAEFGVTQTFGIFMLLSITAGILGDLIFLPALLEWKPGLLGLTKEINTTVNDLSHLPPLPRDLATTPLRPRLTLVIEPSEDSLDDETADRDLTPSSHDSKQRKTDMKSKIAASVLFALLTSTLVLTIPHVSQAADKARRAPASISKDVIQQDYKKRFATALSQFSSKDESVAVKMTIIEPDGSRLTRELSLERVGQKGEQRLLARIQSPADLKGTSLLSIVTKDSENQWVYLPSSKQVRKVVTSTKSEGGVLGSELRYEDFDPSVIRETKARPLPARTLKGKTYDIIEASLPKGNGPYDKAQVWILKENDSPAQIDYFAGGKKVKSIQFLAYKKVDSVLRPHRLVIKNLSNRRGTEIELSQLRINQGLSLQKLSVDSLAKSW